MLSLHPLQVPERPDIFETGIALGTRGIYYYELRPNSLQAQICEKIVLVFDVDVLYRLLHLSQLLLVPVLIDGKVGDFFKWQGPVDA